MATPYWRTTPLLDTDEEDELEIWGQLDHAEASDEEMLEETEVRERAVAEGPGLSSTACPNISLDESETSGDGTTSDSDISDMEILDDVPIHKSSKSRSSFKATAVTPLMGSISQEFFLADMNILGDRLEQHEYDEAASNAICKAILSQDAISKGHTTWGLPLEDGDDRLQYFQSVFIDGTEYKLGDIVLIECGEDSHKSRAKNAESDGAKSVNALANFFWFAQIVSLFNALDEDGHTQYNEKMFHARWLVHGSKTILKEMAHPQELFLTNECDDVHTSAIVTHCCCNSDPLPVGQQEPSFSDDQSETVHPSTQFFYRFFYNKATRAFVDAHRYATTDMNLQYAECFSCAQTQNQELQSQPRLVNGTQTLSFNGSNYHRQDFIFYNPRAHGGDEESVVFGLGQIRNIMHPATGHISVKIECLGRQGSSNGSTGFVDERLIFFTKKIKVIEVSRIAQKFFALPQHDIEDMSVWLKHPDTFYIEDATSVVQCHDCLSDLRSHHQKLVQVQLHHQLKAMDIFSGCGGFAEGLDQLGFVETKWAIEMDTSAAKTLKRNCGHMVFNADVNVVLQQAVLGPDAPTIMGLDSQCLPSMPLPGDVDLIYCGPPCQSFSQANRHKKVDDPRHTLSINALSFVDIYRPKYFILENVKGMSLYTLFGRDKTRGGSKMGLVKIIMRCLHTMGYQVHCNLLQACGYGVPQSRDRLIFLAAKQGLPLPEFPLPTHSFPTKYNSIDMNDGYDSFQPPKNHVAAFPAVTVDDAIGDLPRFNWKDPFDNNSAGVNHHKYAGMDAPELRYPYDPMNRYQLQMRQPAKLEAGMVVKQHFTKDFNDSVIQRVVHVPMEPMANHHNLPEELQVAQWVEKTHQQYSYRRIDGDGLFATSLCSLNPHSQTGYCIHPNQKRVITLREYARSQGFPDDFEFHTVKGINALFSQVGNAVPIPLGAALGRELGKAVVAEFMGNIGDDGMQF